MVAYIEDIQYWSQLASLQVPGVTIFVVDLLIFLFFNSSCGHICCCVVLFSIPCKQRALPIWIVYLLLFHLFKLCSPLSCKTHIFLNSANYIFLPLLLQHTGVLRSTRVVLQVMGYWYSFFANTFSNGRKRYTYRKCAWNYR